MGGSRAQPNPRPWAGVGGSRGGQFLAFSKRMGLALEVVEMGGGYGEFLVSWPNLSHPYFLPSPQGFLEGLLQVDLL